MVAMNFEELEEAAAVMVPGGIIMKKDHNIIEKWPLRLKLHSGHPGAQKEWDVLQASSHTGCERYVVWKRGV